MHRVTIGVISSIRLSGETDNHKETISWKKLRTATSNLPVYNIKAVSRLLGLLPVTLRAWERRYGLPNPIRGDQGYRLYSEHDLCTLRLAQEPDRFRAKHRPGGPLL